MQGLAMRSAVKPRHAIPWSTLALLANFELQSMQHH
jgi:hypothetical protein